MKGCLSSADANQAAADGLRGVFPNAEDGYTEDRADKRAKQDATILFNETQQSNEAAFLSSMQLDRTWASVALTVFRNSSMGYQRQLVDAVRNLGRKMRPDYKEEAVEFMSKQMVRDGAPINKFVPASTARTILENKLYTNN